MGLSFLGLFSPLGACPLLLGDTFMIWKRDWYPTKNLLVGGGRAVHSSTSFPFARHLPICTWSLPPPHLKIWLKSMRNLPQL